jgi:hypothetical protein
MPGRGAQQVLRELRDRENEDQIEEEFDRGDFPGRAACGTTGHPANLEASPMGTRRWHGRAGGLIGHSARGPMRSGEVDPIKFLDNFPEVFSKHRSRQTDLGLSRGRIEPDIPRQNAR